MSGERLLQQTGYVIFTVAAAENSFEIFMNITIRDYFALQEFVPESPF
jgi:hypothetical protein